MTRNSGTWAMRTATPMAASASSPYATARLLSTSEVTIRKPAWRSSPEPMPKTGFSTAGESVNHRGARRTCSLCR